MSTSRLIETSTSSIIRRILIKENVLTLFSDSRATLMNIVRGAAQQCFNMREGYRDDENHHTWHPDEQTFMQAHIHLIKEEYPQQAPQPIAQDEMWCFFDAIKAKEKSGTCSDKTPCLLSEVDLEKIHAELTVFYTDRNLQHAIQISFLYSFLLSIPTSLLKDYFQSETTSQIINTLAALSLSAYVGCFNYKTLLAIIGSPVITHGLKQMGVNESLSQLLPTAAMMTAYFTSDLTNLPKTAASMLATTGAGWLGNKVARIGCHLAKQGFFSIKHGVESLINASQSPSPTSLLTKP